MARYAVTRLQTWDRAATGGMREQELWLEHAVFMDALVEEGFVVLGGPLEGGPSVLLVVEAASTDEIHERLASDPWTQNGLLETTSVREWQVLLRAGSS